MKEIIGRFNYRPEIDGLRALAVIPVMLFHFQMLLPGGYLGVDVFFVISGFLITSILIRDFESGNFNLRNFWERRARRILPVSFMAVAIITLVGYFLLLPSDYDKFGKSLTWQALFASNIFFDQHINYFSGAAEKMPLLHTWSLAVEEQFYFVFPVILWFMFRISNRNRILFFSLAFSLLWIISLAWSIRTTNIDNQSAFFLLPSRAWELLTGSLLALIPARIHPSGLLKKFVFGWIGVVLIIFPYFIYSASTVFPGISALPTCLGTALFIWSAKDLSHPQVALARYLPSRLLSVPIVVFVGKISYSLYLWHWPIAAYINYWYDENWTPVLKICAIGLSIAISLGSYYFVEIPFRKKNICATAHSMLLFSAAGIVAFVFLSGVIRFTDGFKGRTPSSLLAEMEDRSERGKWTKETSLQNAVDNEFIEFGNTNRPNVDLFIWGDSHARASLPGVKRIAEKKALNFQAAWHGGSPPALDFVPTNPFSLGSDTPEYSKAIIDYIIDKDIKHVLLVSFWSHIYNSDSDIEAFERGILKAVSILRQNNRNVWILLDWPTLDISPLQIIWASDSFGIDVNDQHATPETHRKRNAEMEKLSKELQLLGAEVLDPSPLFLQPDQATYKTIYQGHPLYYDTHHLSVRGAGMLEPIFNVIVDNIIE